MWQFISSVCFKILQRLISKLCLLLKTFGKPGMVAHTIITALERLGQKDRCKLEAILGYSVRTKQKVSIPQTHTLKEKSIQKPLCIEEENQKGIRDMEDIASVSSPTWTVLQRSNLHADGTMN